MTTPETVTSTLPDGHPTRIAPAPTTDLPLGENGPAHDGRDAEALDLIRAIIDGRLRYM